MAPKPESLRQRQSWVDRGSSGDKSLGQSLRQRLRPSPETAQPQSSIEMEAPKKSHRSGDEAHLCRSILHVLFVNCVVAASRQAVFRSHPNKSLTVTPFHPGTARLCRMAFRWVVLLKESLQSSGA